MKSWVIGCVVLVVGACAGSAVTALATAPPEVRAATSLVRHVAPHGKARVIPLAQGSNAWLGILELDAGVAVPEHQDPTEEYIHVLSGGGQITIDGTEHRIRTGDTVFMPANATVSYTNGPTALKAMQVFAGPSPAKKYASWPPRAQN
ncbi:MAG: cupin domain-containing protein [Myxococcota bacterium]